MLLRLADRYFDRGHFSAPTVFDGGLDAVAEELADDVFEVREDVREGGVEVAGEFDGWEGCGGPVGDGGEGCDFAADA